MKNIIAKLCAVLLFACGASAHAQVTKPPASLNLDPYYGKYIDAYGIPIVSHAKVNDRALIQMKKIVETMLGRRWDVRNAMLGKITILIIPKNDGITSLPEYQYLDQWWPLPGSSWDQRARGLGWTEFLPYQSCGEENLLHLSNDRYVGESICVHEFAHALFDLGMMTVDPQFNDRMTVLYNDALTRGIINNTYAAQNFREYAAEGAQSWYDANICKNPADGIHNDICTNQTLWNKDPNLWWELSYILPRLAPGNKLY